MAFESLSDIYDPIEIKKLIGQDWQNDAKMMGAGIIKLEPRPIMGTTTSELRQKRFQDTTGQAVAAGDSISSQKRTQTRTKHPVIWRYNSADEPDVIKDIEQKDIPIENADMATSIRTAAAQYFDDSIISVIKGTGAALTGNQAGSGAVITLANLVAGKEALDDQGIMLDGAMCMRSAVYWKMVKLGMVSESSNTFGVAPKELLVRTGKLEVNVLGLTPVVSDKFASLGSNQYYVYYIGMDAIIAKGNEAPEVEVAKATVNKKFSTITNFKLRYGLGFDGVTWGGPETEVISDTDLETSSNWTLAKLHSKNVPIARVHVATA